MGFGFSVVVVRIVIIKLFGVFYKFVGLGFYFWLFSY